MSAAPRPIPILVAEDSQHDRMILTEAFEQLDLCVALTFVADGEELLDYLRRGTADLGANLGTNLGAAPVPATPLLPALVLPALIMMDLNMPRMNGIDTLQALRADPTLRALPVIVLSTSDQPRQIALAYAHGVNTFLTKPWQFEELVALLDSFGAFWLRGAKLPDIAAIL